MYRGSGLFGLPASASLAFFSSLEPPWPVLDPLGANLRSSWTQLGTILGPTWPSLGPTWPGLGPSWASFGPIWGQFPRAGAALARLGPNWGKFGVTLDPTWSHAEANLAQRGAILGQLGGQVGAGSNDFWPLSIYIRMHGSSHDAWFWLRVADYGQYRQSDRPWPSAETEPITGRPGHK